MFEECKRGFQLLSIFQVDMEAVFMTAGVAHMTAVILVVADMVSRKILAYPFITILKNLTELFVQ